MVVVLTFLWLVDGNLAYSEMPDIPCKVTVQEGMHHESSPNFSPQEDTPCTRNPSVRGVLASLESAVMAAL